MNELLRIAAIAIAVVCGGPATTAAVQHGSQNSEASPNLIEASRLSQRVVVLHGQGKFDEALPLAKQALEIRQKELGTDHQLVGVAFKNIASLHFGKKHYDEAAKAYQRALSVYEKAVGPGDIKTAEILDYLGWSSYGNGDTGKAERCLLRALSIREKSLGPDSAEVGEALYVVGQFYHKSGNAKKAVDFYKRAIPVKEAKLGSSHKDFLALLEKCSCALGQLGRKDEASELQKRIASERAGSAKHVGSVLQGSAIFRVEPVYPAGALKERLSGSVIVEVTVDESGTVIQARAICGPDLLVPASVEAARRWRFSPTTLSGVPVKVIGTITFNFHI